VRNDGLQCTKHITAIGTANAAKRTTEKINIFFMATSYPNFGMGGRATPQPGGQPMTNPSGATEAPGH